VQHLLHACDRRLDRAPRTGVALRASECAAGGCQQAEQYAGERGMQAGTQHSEPHHRSRQHIGERSLHPQPLQQQQPEHARRDDQQPPTAMPLE